MAADLPRSIPRNPASVRSRKTGTTAQVRQAEATVVRVRRVGNDVFQAFSMNRDNPISLLSEREPEELKCRCYCGGDMFDVGDIQQPSAAEKI